MGLGLKARGEPVRIHLAIQGATPTGSPQIEIKGPLYLEDLATDGAGTGVSSAIGGFESDMVNGKLYIFSGVGFTAGDYDVTVHTDTNNITIGSSAGANATLGRGIVTDSTILAATNMTQGVAVYLWYYDYRVASDAQFGQYQVIISAVISGITYYAEINFNVSARSEISTGGSDEEYE